MFSLSDVICTVISELEFVISEEFLSGLGSFGLKKPNNAAQSISANWTWNRIIAHDNGISRTDWSAFVSLACQPEFPFYLSRPGDQSFTLQNPEGRALNRRRRL
jgi:hypothetical protein